MPLKLGRRSGEIGQNVRIVQFPGRASCNSANKQPKRCNCNNFQFYNRLKPCKIYAFAFHPTLGLIGHSIIDIFHIITILIYRINKSTDPGSRLRSTQIVESGRYIAGSNILENNDPCPYSTHAYIWENSKFLPGSDGNLPIEFHYCLCWPVRRKAGWCKHIPLNARYSFGNIVHSVAIMN